MSIEQTCMQIYNKSIFPVPPLFNPSTELHDKIPQRALHQFLNLGVTCETKIEIVTSFLKFSKDGRLSGANFNDGKRTEPRGQQLSHPAQQISHAPRSFLAYLNPSCSLPTSTAANAISSHCGVGHRSSSWLPPSPPAMVEVHC
jgi:hypothetical protein